MDWRSDKGSEDQWGAIKGQEGQTPGPSQCHCMGMRCLIVGIACSCVRDCVGSQN